MQIDCPNCGRRDVQEFSYGEVPEPPPGLDPAALAVHRRFYSANPDGVTTERWFHSLGCRRWLTIRRDRSAP